MRENEDSFFGMIEECAVRTGPGDVPLIRVEHWLIPRLQSSARGQE